MAEFRFATDSETGTIEAADFADACVQLRSMLTDAAIDDGAWGWVEDENGVRHEPLAWKYNDPTEDARFLFERAEVAAIEAEDPSLIKRIGDWK